MDFLGDLPLAGPFDDPLLHLPDLPEYLTLRIPPLHDPVPFHSYSRPSPLEPSAGSDREAQNSKDRLSSRKRIRSPSAKPGEAANRASSSGYDGNINASARPSNQQLPKTALPLTISLRVLEKKTNDLDGEGPRKRIRLIDAEKTPDFVKLPKPHARTQKDQQIKPTFGPFTILNGLVEPPPNAALLPPIEADSMKTSLPNHPEPNPSPNPPLQEKKTGPEPTEEETVQEGTLSASEPAEKKTRTRRKFVKWSKQETEDLLHGVAKFGIGNWKVILEHPYYHFNYRNPTDLKDRFRVCCPNAYNSRPDNKASPHANGTSTQQPSNLPPASQKPAVSVSTSLIHTSNILHPQSPSPILEPPQSPTATDSTPPTTKSKAHALSPSALSSLGITNFTPSARRSRRPFTAEEDAALLRGITAHGFAWSVIQKDNEQYGLGHRRSTDLRDRIRNRWPEWYAGAVPGPVPGNSVNEAGGKENSMSEASALTATTTAIFKNSSKGKNRENQPSSGSNAPSTSYFTSKLNGAPAEPAQNSMAMPSLAPSTGLGTSIASGPGFELPAIGDVVGDHSYLIDDGGIGGAGVDDFDWSNTLPPLFMLDDVAGLT